MTDDEDNDDIYYYLPTCFIRFCDYQGGTQEYMQYTTVAQNAYLKPPDVTVSIFSASYSHKVSELFCR